jgi:hypothetical protein
LVQVLVHRIFNPYRDSSSHTRRMIGFLPNPRILTLPNDTSLQDTDFTEYISSSGFLELQAADGSRGSSIQAIYQYNGTS